jgi:hypothetical protein
MRMRQGIVWEFKTKNFVISLHIERERHYQYDGDDEDGETQAKLDSGEYVAFDSFVTVECNGVTIGRDSLCGSVYSKDNYHKFWTAHRDPNPLNRNCSIMRKARGANVVICHYFPSMVSQAIKEARDYLSRFPRVRAA